MKYQILLFYKYVTITEPEVVAEAVRKLAIAHNLLGRALIAHEGINATLEGTVEDSEDFLLELFTDPDFADISVKRSESNGHSFPKLKVKVRDEIVGTKFTEEEADPRVKTAPRITAEELRTWYKDEKDFVIVDMRNDYEYQSGHFKDSINPGLESSRELPKAIPALEQYKDKTLLTVCTGGVRCEKMSAYLQHKGFKDVYQLEDGIHGYMEKYPGKDFLGTLYTFDNRLTMHFGGEDREVVGICKLCGEKTENYVNCANDFCHLHFIACEECIKDTPTYCEEDCPVKKPAKRKLVTGHTS
jgi:UPF0176 protein